MVHCTHEPDLHDLETRSVTLTIMIFYLLGNCNSWYACDVNVMNINLKLISSPFYFAGLIVVGILVVIPYGRVSQYVSSFCYPVQVHVDPQERRCSCGKGCTSFYPCSTIKVYVNKFNSTQFHNESAILYENEAMYGQQVSVLT